MQAELADQQFKSHPRRTFNLRVTMQRLKVERTTHSSGPSVWGLSPFPDSHRSKPLVKQCFLTNVANQCQHGMKLAKRCLKKSCDVPGPRDTNNTVKISRHEN